MARDVRVTVRGLVPTPTGCGVFLGAGEKVMAIFVDHGVAAAMTMALHRMKAPRPLTHELMDQVLRGLGAKVQKVVINAVQEETFFARLFIGQANELGRCVVEIDARPSDAITLALRQESPIYVDASVWAQAEDMSGFLRQAESSEGAGPPAGEPPPAPPA